MPRVKITDGDKVVEIESNNKTTSDLFTWARKVMDRRNDTGFWMPEDKQLNDLTE